MYYGIIATDDFEKDIIYYIKKKRYKNIDNDIETIINQLEQGIFVGEKLSGLMLLQIYDVDIDVYKARASNRDLKVGKSNGYRLIYAVNKESREIYLLTIYSKKDFAEVSDSAIRELLKKHLE